MNAEKRRLFLLNQRNQRFHLHREQVQVSASPKQILGKTCTLGYLVVDNKFMGLYFES